MTSRPRILLISPDTSYRIAPYLNAARKLNLEVVLAAHGPYVPVNPLTSHGINIDLTDSAAAQAKIINALVSLPVRAVIATDDATVELASQVAQALGLPHNPVVAARYSHRKDLARACLSKAGVQVPEHRLLDLAAPLSSQLQGLTYPCVIKPVAFSGSRGVIRADDADELLAACARVQTLLRDVADETERRYVLVERYIPGQEVALEGLLHGGRLQTLALFDKPDPLEGPFFEETYYTTPSRLSAPIQERVATEVQRACEAYGLCEGPVHAELRLEVDRSQVSLWSKPWIIEVAARTIGGECARLLEFGSGHRLEELVLGQAVGRPLESESAIGAAGVLMIPIPKAGILRRVEGVLAASRIEHIVDVVITMREGQQITPLPEGSSYLGFIFAQAPAPQLAEAALRKAHDQLNIVVAPLVSLTPVSAV